MFGVVGLGHKEFLVYFGGSAWTVQVAPWLMDHEPWHSWFSRTFWLKSLSILKCGYFGLKFQNTETPKVHQTFNQIYAAYNMLLVLSDRKRLYSPKFLCFTLEIGSKDLFKVSSLSFRTLIFRTFVLRTWVQTILEERKQSQMVWTK